MKEQMNEIEKIRITARNTNILAIVVSVLGAIIYFLTKNNFVLIGFVFVLILLVTTAVKKLAEYRYACRDFELRYPIEGVLGEKVKVVWDGIEMERVENANIIPFANQFQSENTVSFLVDGFDVICSDVLTQLKYTLDGRSAKIQTLFSGKYYVVSLPQSDIPYMAVRDKSIEGTNIENFFKNAPKYPKVQGCDEEFDKHFLLYIDGENRTMCEQCIPYLNRLKTMHSGTIYFGVVNNEIHIALSQEQQSKEAAIYESIHAMKTKDKLQEMENIVQLIKAVCS